MHITITTSDNLEARGRNGEFIIDSIHVFPETSSCPAQVSIFSSKIGKRAPIQIKGSIGDITTLFRAIADIVDAEQIKCVTLRKAGI